MMGGNALKIAQPFMAGVPAHGHHEVQSGTKEMVCRPRRDLEKRLPVFPAINGWAILADNQAIAGNRGGFLFVQERAAYFT